MALTPAAPLKVPQIAAHGFLGWLHMFYLIPLFFLACLIGLAVIAVSNRNAPKRIPRYSLFGLGNTVQVVEDIDRPDMAWHGVVVSNIGGSTQVRDINYPYAVVDIPKSYVFPEDFGQ